MPLEIPSPPINGFYIGPLFIYFYALCILTGMIVASILSQRRYVARGGDGEQFQSILLAIIVCGIIGARAYHVLTHLQDYVGPGIPWWEVFNLRGGGIAIMGGIGAGTIAAWVMCRRYRIDFPSLGDVIAPNVLFAQAIGRLGNWFNQELFGVPTDLPWGLAIDERHRPPGYEAFDTFHPTFAYEMIWNITGGFVLLWAERRFRLGRGKVLVCYLIWYNLGRFFIELVRIDPANEIFGIRVNAITAALTCLVASAALIWLGRFKPGVRLWPFGFCRPQGHLEPRSSSRVES